MKKKKNENEKQNENKNQNQNEFLFLFSIFFFIFVLVFVFAFKSFCIFVNSMWPSGAIDGQLSLTWPRSAVAFSFANFPCDLAVS